MIGIIPGDNGSGLEVGHIRDGHIPVFLLPQIVPAERVE